MRRRSFFGGIAALFGLGATARAADGPLFTPERDGKGKPVSRVYRQAADGQWRQVRIADIRPGDRIVCVGVCDDRLFMAQAGVVAEMVPARGGDAGGFRSVPGTDAYLLPFSNDAPHVVAEPPR